MPPAQPDKQSGPLTRAFWDVTGAIRWGLRPLESPLRIREELSTPAKLSLVTLFLVLLFALWCGATTSPEWLDRALESVRPAYRVEAGQPVEVRLDREGRQIRARRQGSGRDVVLQLPQIVPEALPVFDPQNYPKLFDELRGFGLGEFRQRLEDVWVARVVDVAKARSSGGFDPMPFQLPVTVGEPVVFVLDTLRGRLGVSLARDSLRKAQVPYRGDPKRLEEQAVAQVAPRMGVASEFERRDETTLSSRVVDPALFRETTSLGPQDPIEPLQAGEELLVLFKPGEQSVSVEMPRTRKQRSLPVSVDRIASAALPELSLAAYPGLPATLASVGVGVRPTADKGLGAFVEDVDKAVAHGFGLYKPREARRISHGLPSPTEVADGLPSLWKDRNLMGGWGLELDWPLLTDFSTRKVREALDGPNPFAGLTRGMDEVSWARAPLRVLGNAWDNLHLWLAEVDFNYLAPFLRDFSWTRFTESALFISLKRIVVAFFWAVLLAVPLGILMGSFTKVYYFFEPLRIAGLYLPLPAFVPLTLFWAGIHEDQRYLFLFICNFVVLLPYVIVSIQSVPQVFLDTAATLGLTRWQIVRRVLVAVALPDIFKGLRFTFGVGWTWIILAENIGVDNGLGYIIWTSERRGHPEHVYVVILLIMLLAFLINALWTYLIYWLFPHERSR